MEKLVTVDWVDYPCPVVELCVVPDDCCADEDWWVAAPNPAGWNPCPPLGANAMFGAAPKLLTFGTLPNVLCADCWAAGPCPAC